MIINEKSKKLLKIILFATIIFQLGLIFYFSSKPASESKKQSKNVTQVIVDTIDKVSPDKASNIDATELDNFVRKNAHFFLYLILGLLLINLLNLVGIRSFKGVALTFIASVIYSIFDEFHQKFVNGRGSQVSDVIIDTLGASVGILIFIGFKKLKKSSLS